ncbi:hypothetical protein ALC57_10602, partial [Trachymyrmex cornetzi]
KSPRSRRKNVSSVFFDDAASSYNINSQSPGPCKLNSCCSTYNVHLLFLDFLVHLYDSHQRETCNTKNGPRSDSAIVLGGILLAGIETTKTFVLNYSDAVDVVDTLIQRGATAEGEKWRTRVNAGQTAGSRAAAATAITWSLNERLRIADNVDKGCARRVSTIQYRNPPPTRDGRLSFLDTMIIIENQRIIFDRYTKETFSGRFLGCYSHHPLCHKRSIIFGFVDKIMCLSHPRFHQKSLTSAIQIFLDNGYPFSFIFSAIEQKIKYHVHNNITEQNLHAKEKYFTVPYVKSISESFVSIAMKFHCKLAFSIPNTLKNFIKKRQTRKAKKKNFL